MSRLKEGQTVTFIGCTPDQENFVKQPGHPNRHIMHLTVGSRYIIEGVEEHSWHTRVWLEGIPGVWFNSVCFEETPPC